MSCNDKRLGIDTSSGHLTISPANPPSPVDRVVTPIKNAWSSVENAASPLRDQLSNVPDRVNQLTRSFMEQANQVGAALPDWYTPIAKFFRFNS